MPYLAWFHWGQTDCQPAAASYRNARTHVGVSCFRNISGSDVHFSIKGLVGHPSDVPATDPLESLIWTLARPPVRLPVTNTSTRAWSPGTSRLTIPGDSVLMPAPRTAISWREFRDVSRDWLAPGSRLASVTSTAWARTPLIVSHRVVNLARRTESAGARVPGAGTTDGDSDMAKMCSLRREALTGRVMLFRGCSEETAVDHWWIWLELVFFCAPLASKWYGLIA